MAEGDLSCDRERSAEKKEDARSVSPAVSSVVEGTWRGTFCEREAGLVGSTARMGVSVSGVSEGLKFDRGS